MATASCTIGIGGEAAPAPTPAVPTSKGPHATTTPSSPSSGNKSSTPGTTGHHSASSYDDPCSLLTLSEATSVAGAKIADPRRKDIDEALGCHFYQERANVVVGTRPPVTLPGTDPTVRIGRYDVAVHAGPEEDICQLVISSATRTFDVVVSAPSPDDPCEIGKSIAALVEPRLPAPSN